MVNRKRIAVLITFWLLLQGNTVFGRSFAPRVVSEHNADAYSMKTFARHPVWREQSGDLKAWEMYNYLTDYRTGLYPMGEGAFEGTETQYEYSLVRDPVKMINVYSVGYCDVFGPVMAGIWQDAGLGKARVVDLPDYDHITAEVFYDNDWHYLDLDLRSAFRRNDGSLASLAESIFNPSLWDRPNGPRFFPLDPLEDVRQAYQQSELNHRYDVHQSGHTMDFILRQGESFTRWWKPQGGRWLHHVNYENQPFVKDIIEQLPRGPKSKHASYTKHAHGNGQFLYQPDLSQLSTDFFDGVYDSKNVEPSSNGLVLSESGLGYAVFEVRTPYVIVPLVGDTATTADDRDASVIDVDASGASFSVSLDNGITWQQVTGTGSQIDLTNLVAGKYSYLFKIELSGAKEQAVVRSLSMNTWVQLAPASLPSLRTGTNQMEFRTGDHYGLQTKVMEIQPDTSNRTDFLKHVVVSPREYNPDSMTSRIVGPFVVEVEAPPNTKIAWFSAGGSYQTFQMESAPLTNFSMAYAPELPFNYTEFYSADMPSDMGHWHANAQAEVQLSEPAEAVYLRYSGDPAVNAVRIYAHTIDNTPRIPSTVNITHRWMEEDQLKTFNATTDNGSTYSIDVASQPEDVSITMSIDSQFNPDTLVTDQQIFSRPIALVSTGSFSWSTAALLAFMVLINSVFSGRRRLILLM